MKTEKRIARFIERELLEDAGPGDPLARGLLDSLGFEALAAWIDEAFGVQLRDEDFVAENLGQRGLFGRLRRRQPAAGVRGDGLSPGAAVVGATGARETSEPGVTTVTELLARGSAGCGSYSFHLSERTMTLPRAQLYRQAQGKAALLLRGTGRGHLVGLLGPTGPNGSNGPGPPGWPDGPCCLCLPPCGYPTQPPFGLRYSLWPAQLVARS